MIHRCWWRYLLVICYCLLLTIEENLAQSMTDPSLDFGGGEAFQEPDQEKDSSSSWDTTLNVDIGSFTYNWLELKRRVYNGKIAGPTITMKRGDSVTVTLNNNLSPDGNDLGRPINSFDHPNSTNLHTHGLHISTKSPQDNVLVTVNPNSSYRYVYQILNTHAAGTHWYHAHVHGSTLFQVSSGLSGMLIVEDDVADMPAELANVSCPTNCDKDIQMLFQPILMYRGTVGFAALQASTSDYEGFQHHSYMLADGTTLTDWLAHNVDYYTTNGQLQPNLSISTGELYRFRMVNAGGEHSLEIYIVEADNTASSACDIREIAMDGLYLDAPRQMHDGQTFLSPGSRTDWLVKCNVEGTFKLRSFANPAQDLSVGALHRFTGDLVTLHVVGTPSVTQDFPTTLPARPAYMRDLQNITDVDIDGRFVVEMNPPIFLNRERWSGPDHYRYKMTLGSIQEWYFLNTDPVFPHPMHIHVNPFQVISYNEYTGSYGIVDEVDTEFELYDVNDETSSCFYQHAGFTSGVNLKQGVNRLKYLGHDTRYADDDGNTLGYARVGEWRDTVLVPPLANITVRFVADEFIGDVIVHCHILGHEDTGMMMITEVVAEGQSTDANAASGNAYPGTCKECDRYPFNNSTRLCDSITPTVTSAPNNTSETTSGAEKETLSFSITSAYVMTAFAIKLV